MIPTTQPSQSLAATYKYYSRLAHPTCLQAYSTNTYICICRPIIRLQVGISHFCTTS